MKEKEAIKLHIAENIHRIEVIEDFLRTNSDANDKECRKNIDILTKINKALEEVQQYLAIGTPEECRAAVEKQKTKKPIRNDKCTCPSCGTHNEVFKKRRNTVAHDIVYCWHCGHAVEIDRLEE